MTVFHGSNRFYPRADPIGGGCWTEYPNDVCGLTDTTNFVAIGGTVMAGNGEKVRITDGGLLIDDASTADNYIELGDGQTTPVSIGTKGRLRYNQATTTFQVSVNGAAYVDLAVGLGAGPWDRTGTVVHLDFSTDEVSVGTAAPPGAEKFFVVNDNNPDDVARLRGSAAQAGHMLRLEDSGGVTRSGFEREGSLFFNAAIPDQERITVAANAAQTADLLLFQDSVGSDLGGFAGDGSLFFTAAVIDVPRVTILANAGQTADIWQVRDSTNSFNQVSVDANGNLTLHPASAGVSSSHNLEFIARTTVATRQFTVDSSLGVGDEYRLLIRDHTNSDLWRLNVDVGVATELSVFTDSVVLGGSGPVGAEVLRVVGDTRIEGKLTVTGVIDPTALILSDPAAGTDLFYESDDGQTAGVSGGATGRIRYNDSTATFQISTQGGAYADIATGPSSGPWTLSGTDVFPDLATYNVQIGTVGGQAGTETLRVVGHTLLEQVASTSGTPPVGLQYVGAAHTTIANAEAIDVELSLNRTVQFTGAVTLATQRAVVVRAPTYSSDTPTKEITEAATFAIEGPPVAGTNVTIPDGNYSFFVQSGPSFFLDQFAGSSGGQSTAEFESIVQSGAQTETHSAVAAIATVDGSATASSETLGVDSIAQHNSTGAHTGLIAGVLGGAGGNGTVVLGAMSRAAGVVGFLEYDFDDGSGGTGAITDGAALLAIAPENLDATHTVTTIRGLLVENQGVAGATTNVYGIDIEAQSGGSGENLGARIASGVTVTSGALTMGTSAAATGAIRLENAAQICGITTTAADVCFASVTAANVVQLGDPTNSSGTFIVAPASNNIVFQIGGGNDYVFNDTRFRNNKVEMTFGAAVVSPVFYQENETGVGATGDVLLIHAQDATGGGGATGGGLTIRAGSGDASNGALQIQDGGATTRYTFSGDGDHTITIRDAVGGGYVLEDTSGDDYINISTAAGSEVISLGNATNNPDLTLLGSGDFTVGTLAKVFGTSGDTVFGAVTMSGTETLRVVGAARVEGLVEVKAHAAFAGSEANITTGAVQTTDATVNVTALAFTLADNTVYTFEATITARDEAGTERASYVRTVQCYRQAAGAATLGAAGVQNDFDDETSAGMNATFTVSSNDIRVSVTGLGATDINWVVTLTYQGVSDNA